VTVIGFPIPGPDDDLEASMRRHPAGRGVAAVHPGEWRLTRDDVEAAAPSTLPTSTRDHLRRQIARAFDVPFTVVDEAAGRAELELRRREADRWADDGGPCPAEPLTAGEFRVLLVDALGRLVRGVADAVRPLFDVFRQLAESAVTAMRRFGRMMNAGRWRTDVEPRRWRDWLPSAERPIDRARRQHVDEQMRTVARRTARRRRIRARKAEPWRQIAAAARRGGDALDVLRAAADGSR
jgi:hypothetical protein